MYMYLQKATQDGKSKLYVHCLSCVLKIVGPSLVNMVPTEMDDLFAKVKDQLLSVDTPAYVICFTLYTGTNST